jgi:hypothetical protein
VSYLETIDDIKSNQLYTPVEVAYITGYSYQAITQHLRNKNLKGYKPRGSRVWKILGSNIREWLQGYEL